MNVQAHSRGATDLADLVTVSAKTAACSAADAGIVFSFDYRGPTFESPTASEQLPAIIDPLLRQALARAGTGFVFFWVDVLVHRKGSATVIMQITSTTNRGAVPLIKPSSESMSGGVLVPGLVDAEVRARCAALSGDLSIGAIAQQGYVCRADVLLPCPPEAADFSVAERHGHTAWLVGDPPVVFESVERRLQRLGWFTETFRSAQEAEAARGQAGRRLPSVVMSQERYGVSLAQLRSLADLLPDKVQIFFEPLVKETHSADAADRIIRVTFPLSPHELLALTESVIANRDEVLGAPPSSASTFDNRPLALLADDNLVNQILSTEVLNMLGFEVELANNGKEAVEHCLERLPDVILMDLDMPVMDGIEAAQHLRALAQAGKLPRIPILAVTARIDERDRQDAADAGMDSFVEKPIDIPFLHRELRRLLPSTARRVPLA